LRFEDRGMTGLTVNPPVKAGNILLLKFDDAGAITLIAAGAGYVLCRRKECIR
jgi:hypothetical protein